MTRPFNPFAYAEDLAAAGVPRQQGALRARALTEVVDMAVKPADLAALEHGLVGEIRLGAARTDAGLAAVRAELLAEMAIYRPRLPRCAPNLPGIAG